MNSNSYPQPLSLSIQAFQLEEGMEIELLGHVSIVEAVTMFGPNDVIVHTTQGPVAVRAKRWITVLS